MHIYLWYLVNAKNRSQKNSIRLLEIVKSNDFLYPMKNHGVFNERNKVIMRKTVI